MAKNFTLDSYDELQKCLEEEMKILPKVFPEFANLPNLHINIHLLVHARTYGTLINTQVGIKEDVDGGADQRLSQPCRGFATMSSNFRNLLTNWYITEDKVSNEQEPEENEEAISSPVDFITNIILKRSLSLVNTSQDIRWRRIFPISIIDHVQKVHFVYDTKIDLWIKNNYYFTAI
ncbi:hypothetical protein GLOIN_2v1790377 [Rhizophagus clarus]|uniref:Uncharacterized protein n=1 Tax=Rhizophagus clarus TaxID=94130 RepID=A0A8H3M0N6_9GLOM|nr:hypothetical protein GLOIN_2v1790377 [Rhizophagus clarus]